MGRCIIEFGARTIISHVQAGARGPATEERCRGRYTHTVTARGDIDLSGGWRFHCRGRCRLGALCQPVNGTEEHRTPEALSTVLSQTRRSSMDNRNENVHFAGVTLLLTHGVSCGRKNEW